MTNFFKLRNLYKLILFIFIAFAIIKIRSQFVDLKSYNSEIVALNQKIATLEEQAVSDELNSNKSKKENEDMARKNLKMYYPNETPYIGY